jgi:hypothetical protein
MPTGQQLSPIVVDREENAFTEAWFLRATRKSNNQAIAAFGHSTQRIASGRSRGPVDDLDMALDDCLSAPIGAPMVRR